MTIIRRILPLLCLCFACTGEEPVLPGVPETPILPSAEDIAAADRAASEQADQAEAAAAYEKAPGVEVDVRYFGGKDWHDVRDLVAAQLGPPQGATELTNDGQRELVFERGVVRLEDDRVYMVRVHLETPLRRTDALRAMGFATYVGEYIVLHREYRLNHEWGFRRLRMKRQSTANELVTEVEAWRWVPGEHSARR